jgi:PPOX class probable FMN-dependent enzyme
MEPIADVTALRAIYGEPRSRSVLKQLSALERHSRHFIALSPFCLLATSDDTRKTDVTPRGGPPGFVRILDDRQLLLPDWPGNNRLDSLLNVLVNPEVGLLFLIPGIDESLRINGTAQIFDDEALRGQFVEHGRLPRTVLLIQVREVYLHCAKALMRSSLWQTRVDRSVMPSMGQMIKDQIGSVEHAETQAEMLERYRATLY